MPWPIPWFSLSSKQIPQEPKLNGYHPFYIFTPNLGKPADHRSFPISSGPIESHPRPCGRLRNEMHSSHLFCDDLSLALERGGALSTGTRPSKASFPWRRFATLGLTHCYLLMYRKSQYFAPSMMVFLLSNWISGLNPSKKGKSLLHERMKPISFIPICS